MSRMAEHDADESTLDKFIRFADTVQANSERAHRPAYAETCACGGSVEVAREVPAAERRRIRDTFVGLHQRCTDPSTRPAFSTPEEG